MTLVTTYYLEILLVLTQGELVDRQRHRVHIRQLWLLDSIGQMCRLFSQKDPLRQHHRQCEIGRGHCILPKRFWGGLGGVAGGNPGGVVGGVVPVGGNQCDVVGGEELFDENRHRPYDFDGRRNLDVGNLNELDAVDSFQACDLSEAVRDLAEAVHDLAEAVLDIPVSKPLNFGQYFVVLQVGKVGVQYILDQMVWISLRAQLQCHLHRNHQQDLRFLPGLPQ